MNCKFLLPLLAAVSFVACHKTEIPFSNEDPSTFTEISSFVAGGRRRHSRKLLPSIPGVKSFFQ